MAVSRRSQIARLEPLSYLDLRHVCVFSRVLAIIELTLAVVLGPMGGAWV